MAEQYAHPQWPAAPSVSGGSPLPAGSPVPSGPQPCAAPPPPAGSPLPVAPPPPAGSSPHAPSGLFPSGPPPRPTYREPHPVTPGAVVAGAAGGAAWLLLFGLLGQDLVSYLWWTVAAGLAAWAIAVVLAAAGDRGVAAGIAVVTAVGWGVAATVSAVRWAATGDWPLW